jgi:hypothetical protein
MGIAISLNNLFRNNLYLYYSNRVLQYKTSDGLTFLSSEDTILQKTVSSQIFLQADCPRDEYFTCRRTPSSERDISLNIFSYSKADKANRFFVLNKFNLFQVQKSCSKESYHEVAFEHVQLVSVIV